MADKFVLEFFDTPQGRAISVDGGKLLYSWGEVDDQVVRLGSTSPPEDVSREELAPQTTPDERFDPVCHGCWRPSDTLVAREDALLCPQCERIAVSWFQHGGGSESSKHGHHMLEVWRRQTPARTQYERSRIP